MCEHSKTDFQTGAYCGLTNEKPNFDTSCDKAKFEGTMKERVVATNVALQREVSKKLSVRGTMIAYIGMGLAIWLGAYLATVLLWEAGWVSGLSIVLVLGGAGMMGVGIRTFINHRQELEVCQRNKSNLDDILSRYGIAYDIDVDVRTNAWGMEDVQHELRMHSVPKKFD